MEGLSSEERASRVQIFGHNKLEEKTVCYRNLLVIYFCATLQKNIGDNNPVIVHQHEILRPFGLPVEPLSWVTEAASLMAIALANSDGTPQSAGLQDIIDIIVIAYQLHNQFY